eukprot:TRINITY_DN5193_c0_g1_i1.p1 TRINITY_DN5193_c0_g1~~TRINITY_DN5193_c0_g1_i1.p1  ORF type:complete len:338 (+),score=95.01 TRINITY_DN5193_c0_g1_i1:32-1045(+)
MFENNYDFVSFDVDHTLIQYNDQLFQIIVDCLLKQTKEIVDIDDNLDFRFDMSMTNDACNGVILDVNNKYILELDKKQKVKRAYVQDIILSQQEIDELYPNSFNFDLDKRFQSPFIICCSNFERGLVFFFSKLFYYSHRNLLSLPNEYFEKFEEIFAKEFYYTDSNYYSNYINNLDHIIKWDYTFQMLDLIKELSQFVPIVIVTDAPFLQCRTVVEKFPPIFSVICARARKPFFWFYDREFQIEKDEKFQDFKSFGCLSKLKEQLGDHFIHFGDDILKDAHSQFVFIEEQNSLHANDFIFRADDDIFLNLSKNYISVDYLKTGLIDLLALYKKIEDQ